MQPFRFLHRRAVDDSAPRARGEDSLHLGILGRLIHRASHLEAQVRPSKAGDRDVGLDHAELARDVRTDLSGGRGGQREYGRLAESRDD